MLVCISMSYPPDTNTQKSSLVTHLLDAKPVTSLEDLNTGTRKKRKFKKLFNTKLLTQEQILDDLNVTRTNLSLGRH